MVIAGLHFIMRNYHRLCAIAMARLALEVHLSDPLIEVVFF